MNYSVASNENLTNMMPEPEDLPMDAPESLLRNVFVCPLVLAGLQKPSHIFLQLFQSDVLVFIKCAFAV